MESRDWEKEQCAQAKVCFREVCERHPGARGARQLLSHGVAAKEINRVALTEGADLIVMSTHGRTGWKRAALGSVTQRVLRLVPCPVFLVPPGVTPSPADVETATRDGFPEKTNT